MKYYHLKIEKKKEGRYQLIYIFLGLARNGNEMVNPHTTELQNLTLTTGCSLMFCSSPSPMLWERKVRQTRLFSHSKTAGREGKLEIQTISIQLKKN